MNRVPLARFRPFWGPLAALLLVTVCASDRAAAQFMPGMTLGTGQSETTSEAEATEIPPEGVAAEDLETLARLMETPGFSGWLRAQATALLDEDGDGVPDPTDEGANALAIQAILGEFEANLRNRVLDWVSLPNDLELFSSRMMLVLSPDDRVRHLVLIIIFLLIGSGLEWLYWQSAGPALRRVQGQEPGGPWQAFRQTITRLGLQLGALTLFGLGALGAFVAFEWNPVTETAILLALGSLILLRLIGMGSIFVLAPYVPALRLTAVSDRAARWLHGWLMVTAGLVTIGLAIRAFWEEVGGAAAPTGPLGDIVAATLVLMLLFRLWIMPVLIADRSEETVATRTASPEDHAQPQPQPQPLSQPESGPRTQPDALAAAPADAGDLPPSEMVVGSDGLAPDLASEAVPEVTLAAEDLGLPQEAPGDKAAAAFTRRRIIATALILFLYALWLIGADRLMLAVLVLALVGPTIVVVKFLTVDPWLRWRDEKHQEILARAGIEDPDGDAPVQSIDYVTPILERVARFAVIVGALGLIAMIFEDVSDGLSEGPVERLLEASADILVALLIAELVWTLAKTAIDRRLSAFQAASGPGGGGGEGGGGTVGSEARLATLLPLIRNTVLTVLLAMVGLIGLSSLGINIGPLLAGAGVVGIAVGFGAQTLVRDIVSGIFFLIDDAFRVGEYIEMDALRGTVEGISLRSMKLRHHRGAVHTVPFGEIKSVTNYSRDWVIMKLEFRVPFETDLALVKKLVKQIGRELSDDPTYGPQFLEPVKSQGVRRMEEFNMVIGVKFMTKPGEQWLIRREVYQRIRDAFEARGIHFAQRNVKVEVIGAGDGPIDEETRNAAVGAAQDAIERQAGVQKA